MNDTQLSLTNPEADMSARQFFLTHIKHLDDDGVLARRKLVAEALGSDGADVTGDRAFRLQLLAEIDSWLGFSEAPECGAFS
jgi:hypothetical protein